MGTEAQCANFIEDMGRNRRSTKWVTVDGSTMSLAEAVEKYGVSYGAVQRRLDKGWTADKAIMTPIKPSHRRAA